MTNADAERERTVRIRTGAEISDCRLALADAGGELDAAAALIEERGQGDPGLVALLDLAHGLRSRGHRAAAQGALAALRVLTGPHARAAELDPDHVEIANELADAIEAWLREPNDESLARVRQRTGRAEEWWNDLSGDDGHPEPVLAAATNAGWVVCNSDQLYMLVPTLSEAARLIGQLELVAAVRAQLDEA